MNWYYSKDGTQHGPVAQNELQAKIRSGEVAAGSLVWREGLADWTAANQLAEFSMGQPPAVGAHAPYTPPTPYQTPIPNYLWQSIVVTLMCCLPFGIVAIVFASKVDSLRASGNVQEALDSSRKAKMWCWWGFGVGFAVIFLYILMVISMAVASSSY